MKYNTLTDYMKWFCEKMYEVQKNISPNYIYKISGQERSKKNGEELLIVQIVGKDVFTRISPRELVADTAILSGFSQLDVRTITYLAYQHQKRKTEKQPESKFKILAQFFSRDKQKEMLLIKEKYKETQIVKSVQEISNNPEFIKKFSPLDAHTIGFVAGMEQAINDIEKIQDVKRGHYQ